MARFPKGYDANEMATGIDKDRLDEEWLAQPVLMESYCKKLVAAEFDVKECKDELEVVSAELDSSIREDPSEYGLTKVTEDAIKNVIRLRHEYQTALAALRKAERRYGIWSAVRVSLDHRKKALEKLVDLHGQSYYATPRTSGENSRDYIGAAEKRAARKARPRKRD